MFKDGHKKVGGRKRGSLNTSTKQVRESIIDLIGDPKKLAKQLDELPLLESVKLRISLLKYIAPTLKQVDNTVDADFKAIREFDISQIYDSTRE